MDILIAGSSSEFTSGHFIPASSDRQIHTDTEEKTTCYMQSRTSIQSIVIQQEHGITFTTPISKQGTYLQYALHNCKRAESSHRSTHMLLGMSADTKLVARFGFVQLETMQIVTTHAHIVP
ncbi:hypothetical protein HELRODRAFT_170764 [Helobdella robusta]|uniref:Uncharacterized protein n=1 Tax=Helobdella robusta TaxID=6412 RepID=T1F3E2_HELRO|nr:hypothetical protein HELRODRAFT_170764 [Helobdella robusta]ESO07429.1 hypothetical protein HELRODRAFT_170764 [Helobdella robusta]